MDKEEEALSHKEAQQKLLSAKGRAVSDCLLDSSMFTALGVLVGTGFGVRQRNLRPLVAYSMIGTLTDIMYGYRVKCHTVIEDLKQSREKFDLDEQEARR